MKPPPSQNYVVDHSIETDSADGYSQPEETAYRIAALLGATMIAGANRDKATERIVGLLPERMPNKLTGPQMAHALVSLTLAPSSGVGVALIRRAMLAMGIVAHGAIEDAVAAVRRSNKIRLKAGGDGSEPVEWYVENANFLCREFESPSLRSRIPDEALKGIHNAQVRVGAERLADRRLNTPVKAPLSTRIALRIIQFILGSALGLIAAAAIYMIFSATQ